MSGRIVYYTQECVDWKLKSKKRQSTCISKDMIAAWICGLFSYLIFISIEFKLKGTKSDLV